MNCSSSQLNASQFKSKCNKLINDEVITCPFSNIRIIRPLIKLDFFKSKMSDKKMVKLNNIRLHISKSKNDIEGDWVTIGVVVDKLPIRKTKNGADYSMWKLNDLQNLDKSVLLMLFGDAHETQWKLTKGSVIGLLNCKILPNKDAKSDLTLSIEKGSKLMHLGSSKDFGNCRAPKQNGDMCNAIINMSAGNFCIYHIKADYTKLSSMRAELHASMTGLGVQSNLAKAGKNLQTFNSFKKELKTTDDIKTLSKDKKDELLNKYQSRKAEEADKLSKHIKDNHSITARNLLHYQKAANSHEPKETSYDAAKKLLTEMNLKDNRPVLGKGWKAGEIFDFRLNKKVTGTQLAKQKAIEMMRNRKIEKEDPNRSYLTSNKKGKFDLSNILNKVESNLIESEENLNLTANSNKSSRDLYLNSEVIERRKRKNEEELEAKKAKRAAIDAIMNRCSSHEFELKEQEANAHSKYFQLMEKKEKVEEHMESIYQIECNVIICKICNYTDPKQSDLCKSKKHLTISKKVIKRFFKCKDCNARTHTYGQIYPIKRCTKCGSDKFDKTTMYEVKKGPKLDNEKLLIRGEELKFLNSLK